MPEGENVMGKVYVLDLNEPKTKPVELRMPRNFDLESFNPHGISVYTDPSGKTTFYYTIYPKMNLPFD